MNYLGDQLSRVKKKKIHKIKYNKFNKKINNIIKYI